MSHDYSRLIFSADQETADRFVPALFALGCEGIEEKTDMEWIAFFKGDCVAQGQVFLETHQIPCRIVKLENRDWHAEWKKNLEPVRITKTFWAAPVWKLGNLREQETILIEPKMAFGTGHHETTKMCAQYVEDFAPKSGSLLDVGTGSGLLAILGEKTGISRIVTLDNDPFIMENLEENIHQNHCANIIPFIGTLDALNPRSRFDLITANIISSTIIPMLPRLHDCLNRDGRLILSGLLALEKSVINSLVIENGFEVVTDRILGEWYAMTVKIRKE